MILEKLNPKIVDIFPGKSLVPHLPNIRTAPIQFFHFQVVLLKQGLLISAGKVTEYENILCRKKLCRARPGIG